MWLAVAPYYKQSSVMSLLRMVTSFGGYVKTNFQYVSSDNITTRFLNINNTKKGIP
jgi:hypothetical protein